MAKPKMKILKDGMATECNLATLNTYITPNEFFFVRHRYPTPELDCANCELRICGEVESQLVLSVDELQTYPQKSIVVTTECAGNGRTQLDPPTSGLQFSTGAVGTAEWTGVALRDVLARAGIKPTAVEVLMIGADHNPDPNDTELPQRYERSIPLQKALHEDTLLALKMNGEDIPRDHGYPIRAIIPGWYGMASVKWLTHIELIDKPFAGHYQSSEYVIKQPGESPSKPVTELLVKSLITSPESDELLDSGEIEFRGVAWSVHGVQSVEVKSENGDWSEAALEPERSKYAWRFWSHALNLGPGEHVIGVKATDNKGNMQPEEPEWNELGYEINPIHRIEIEVR